MTRLAVAGLLALILCAAPAMAQQPDDLGPFMRAKLDHAKKVLEGLTLEDFDLVTKSSQEISLISQAAGWQVLQTPEYRAYSVEFRRTVESLREAAKKRNLDGATLAYVEMTMKCVQCHKYVRNVKAADAGDILRPRANDDAQARTLKP